MKDIKDILRDNVVLFAIVVIGAGILGIGSNPPHSEMLQALGAAFIIAGGVGIYMMLATRQVAKKLHERFNVQNELLEKNTVILEGHTVILEGHTVILESLSKIMNKMDDSLREMASSQNKNHSEVVSSQNKNHSEIVSSQNKNHSEMIGVLKRIEDKL